MSERRSSARRRFDPLDVAGMGPDISWLFWGMISWNLGLGLYVNLWPIYVEDLGATPTQIGLVIGLMAIGRLAVMLPSGIFADRFDRRKVIWGGTFLTVPAALIFAFSQTWWHLLPGVLFWGASSIGVASNGSYAAQAAAEGDRARVYTMIYTVGPAFAFIAGPIVGGIVSDAWGIRPLLGAGAALYGAGALAISRISPRALQRRDGDVAPTYREAFREPSVRAMALLMRASLLVMTTGITFIPNYQQDVYGMSLSEIGWLGAIGATGSIVLPLVMGKLRWLTPSRGIAISVAGVGAVCLIVTLTGDWLVSIVAFPMRGWYTVAWVLFGAIVSEATSERLRGRGLGLMEFLGTFGFSVAPLIAGPMFGIAPSLPLLVAAACSPLIVIAALVLERRVVQPATRRAQEAAHAAAVAS